MFKRLVFIIGMVLLLLPQQVGAGTNVTRVATRATGEETAVSLDDKAALATLLDDFFEHELAERNIPGAAVAFVKDGELFYSAGYGLADRENGIVYDPQQTIIRAGSTIKPITALAVMQLVEAGKVELHADVNRYLSSFQVPATFAEPITVHHLLHHTAGLDGGFMGVRAHSEGQLLPLGTFLAESLPPRVHPPGQYRHYHDFNIALAGLVVEEVSGMAFGDYVQANIFQPLGMSDTAMIVPESQLGRLAVGYSRGNGEPQPILRGNYFLHTRAGAAFNTTVHDMVKLMGVYFGKSDLIQPETLAFMQQQQFTHDPHLPGMAFAFDEIFINGHRLLAKAGGSPGMQSRMVLLPEEGVGWFVTYNQFGGGLHSDLTDLLMESYFPAAAPPTLQPALSVAQADLQAYSGSYRELIDAPSESLEKINSLPNQVRVEANEAGGLRLFGSDMQAVGTDLFQRENGRYVVFDRDENGRVAAFYYNRTPYVRIPWYETLGVQTAVLLIALVGSLLGFILAFRQEQSWLKWVVTLVSGSNLLFLLSFTLFFLNISSSSEPPWELLYGIPPLLQAILLIPYVAIGAALVLLVKSWQLRIRRAAVFITLLATLFLIFFLESWNLFYPMG